MTSYSTTIPAPIGGWNARDPLDLMPPEDAIALVNVFPETGSCALRRGFRIHGTGMGSGAVQTVAEFAKVDGVRKLLACANGNIYDATTLGAAATSLGSGFTSNKWQTINFRASGATYIVFMNGVDQPKKWDGTTFSSAAYTHASLANDDTLIQPNSYKSRLYAVEKDTTRFFYTAVDAVEGAMSIYDVGPLLKKGGQLLLTSTWSRDSGNGPADLLLLLSDRGEVLIYEGDNPAASNWALVGRYFIPTPLGRRAAFNLDADLIIQTIHGAVPMSRVLQSGDITQTYITLTDKIQNAYNLAAQDIATSFGWQGVVYPRGRYLLLNIPIVEGTQSDQYVMNMYTGAWCKFTGMNASSWTTFNDKLYFGGIDGTVYEADINDNDNNLNIPMAIKTSFNYCGDRDSKKAFKMVRPIISGSEGLQFLLNIDTDFSNRPLSGTAVTTTTSGSDWNTSDWNTTPWSIAPSSQSLVWYGIEGIGRSAAIRMEGNFNGSKFALSAFHITYEPGNFV